MSRQGNSISRHPLAAAVLTGLLLTSATVFAQDNAATNLDRVTVTGSLIPQTEIENHTPVLTVTAEDIQTRGFTSISEVLQQSSLTTGGIQGGQTSASFTQGAEAAGMFGLNPGYTKYLINGRPMMSYPALYNGGDAFNNISGIPIDIVERIEVLPGGQSSLYGSDAIAGVVNIILKDHMEGGSLSVRGGTSTEGGGSSFRVSGAHGFSALDDRFNALVNVQIESSNPIWGYQRDLTKQNNANGYTAQLPSNDFAVIDAKTNALYMMDPSNCANVAGQFDGTTVLANRPTGQSCGSVFGAGYKTLKNGKDSGQFYSSMTFDVNDNFQLFADVLYSKEKTEYTSGSNYLWWGTKSTMGGFYDQASGKLVNLQRAFAPEDIGGEGYKGILNNDKSRAYQVTLGGKGAVGNWDYSLSFTRGEYRLDESKFQRFGNAINSYFADKVLGPQLGTQDGFGIYNTNWGAFYSPISPEDFAGFTGYTTNHSRTWQNLARAQVTNGSLFSLPGGDAGLAVVVEGGSEGWDYSPDQRLLDGDVWGSSAVAGNGHRSNYAVTSELRMPLLESLTVTASGRYDAFKIADNTVDKATYSVGVEFRPIESLLFRGKYGTAFRAPTLPDAFQGRSGYYAANSTDYYRCGELGYVPGNTDACRYADSVSVYSERAGNPDLEPITADVWNAGIVWAPMANLSISADYYNWKIENEVDTASTDQLLLAEYYCRNGLPNGSSATCQNVADWVVRDSAGNLSSLYTPKMNVARQNLQAVTVGFKYLQDIGRFGSLQFSGNYTNMLKREVQAQPGEDFQDLLGNPKSMWNYDSYAKVRSDASVAWSLDKWTTTLYANYIGHTPNYLAGLNGYEYTHGASGYKAGKWASYTTYNLSVNYRVQDDLTLSLMVNNVFNKMPEQQAHSYQGTSGTPFNNYLYNVYGRTVYVQAKYDFGK